MTALAHVFSLALLHFVWQGILVAILLWIALFAMRKASANVRYVLSCAALAVLLALPAVTGYLLYPRPVPATGVELASAPAQPPASTLPAQTASWLISFQAWAVPVWGFGVLFFSARLVWGSRQVSLMRRRGEPAEEALRAAAAGIAKRMGLQQRVDILISALAAGPSVVGLIRPVILLPAATILGLTPEQLEAVLAHELAHIRRYDYLVNVLQMLAEALLFYHPAVWWTSGRIRRERELCCDDEAVRACGDSFCYARALTALERIRVITPSLALRGTDGPLAYRIKRVMGIAPDENLPSNLAGVVALCLALVCLGVSVNRVRAQVQPDAPGVRVDLDASPVVHRAPVEYPAAAQIKNIKGTVSVEVHLDSSGNVLDARVLSGPDELRKPVLQSVLGWHFAPDAAGSRRVINVEFQSPSQGQVEATVNAPIIGPPDAPLPQAALPSPDDQAAQIEEERRLRRLAQLQQAMARLEDAQKQLVQNQDSNRTRENEMRVRQLELATVETKMLLAQPELTQRSAQLAQAQNPRPTTLDTIPTHPEPMVIPPPVAQQFEGRTLRSIRLAGIGLPTEAFLAQAQVPIREGDTLTQRSIEATIAAVRKFDEHLSERWTTVEPNGIELTIFAPGGRGGGIGAGVGGGIGAGVGGGIGAGVGGGAVIAPPDVPLPQYAAQTPRIIEGIEFSGANRVSQETLRAIILSKAGDVYDEQAVRRDLTALWNTNRFDDIQVKAEPGTRGGITLRFMVTERP